MGPAPRRRPQTLREAAREFHRNGGSRTSKAEQQRLRRESEREEARLEALKKEQTRKAMAKKKAEKEAREREERRRMGLPDPSIKVRSSQPRIGQFLRTSLTHVTKTSDGFGPASSSPERAAQAHPTDSAASIELREPEVAEHATLRLSNGAFQPQPTFLCESIDAKRFHFPISADAALVLEKSFQDTTSLRMPHDQDERESRLEAADVIQSAKANHDLHQCDGPSSPLPPMEDVGSSFFVTNSQVARELEMGLTSPISTPKQTELGCQTDRVPEEPSTVSSNSRNAYGNKDYEGFPGQGQQELAEIEQLFMGLPSQDLDII